VRSPGSQLRIAIGIDAVGDDLDGDLRVVAVDHLCGARGDGDMALDFAYRVIKNPAKKPEDEVSNDVTVAKSVVGPDFGCPH
jgi:hypothetical protein